MEYQELLHHLDHCVNGDRYMSLYGQYRAKGMTHKAALNSVIKEYNLADQQWYQRRFV